MLDRATFMAKVIIRLPHISWRDGRPRFQPGPKIRKLGFKGEDLRHPIGGAWLSLEEATDWAEARDRDIQKRRGAVAAAKQAGKRAPRLPPLKGAPAHLLSIEDLYERWMASPRMKGDVEAVGRKVMKAVAPKTRDDYRKKMNVLAGYDPELYVSPAEALSKPVLYGLYERLWEDRGLATARGSIAVLSSALSWGLRRGLLPRLNGLNPAHGLGMETPDGRVRALTPAEVRAFVAACDGQGRPEIGDSILLGVWTGQRQSDRLGLLDAGVLDGRRYFRQAKTAAIVEVKAAPELEGRLAAAKARRAAWTVQPTHVIVDESVTPDNAGKTDWQLRKPFKADWYRHVFAELRAEAAKTTPSLADARDSDLRDTAVTWLARAGCTHMEIAQVTGHSLQSIHLILKHYLARHREIGDNAIDKMVEWFDRQDGMA